MTDFDAIELTQGGLRFCDNPVPATWTEKKKGLVPGIGPSIAEALQEEGINTPNQLVGNFFLVNRDREAFAAFLRPIFDGVKGANKSHMNMTVQCMYLKFRHS